ncbi:MAG TPA: TspO/MBR family protein [Candidatus Paceibacterota bacterium]|nr:TspO/MBR family protein [Candidatus Paceibacterota bacterium]
MELNYVLIPLIAVATAYAGSGFTRRGVNTWYRDIRKPTWTPPGSVIGAVWTVLYALGAIAALVIWNATPHDTFFNVIIAVFVVNIFLNILWSYLFFGRRKMYAAIWDCLALDLTIVILIDVIAPRSPVASLLLFPYAAWVTFASYLNYRIWVMNK